MTLVIVAERPVTASKPLFVGPVILCPPTLHLSPLSQGGDGPAEGSNQKPAPTACAAPRGCEGRKGHLSPLDTPNQPFRIRPNFDRDAPTAGVEDAASISLTARLQCQGPGMGANCFRFNDGKPVPPILNPFRHKSLPAALSGQWPMRCTTVRIFDEAVGAAGMIVAISSETMSFEK